MKKILPFLTMLLFFASPTLAAPNVVTSIAPVHSLVSSVMAGVGETYLLVRGAASPHANLLRPSDARALSSADLVFWIGPGLELFLMAPFKNLAENAKIVALSEIEMIILLPLETESPGSENSDAINFYDMHLWLDPDNAKIMVGEIARQLSEIDPENSAIYRQNADQTRQALDELKSKIAAVLEPVKERQFIFYHNAYRYFERAFSLFSSASITTNPDTRPSARRFADMRSLIESQGAACIFSEPQFAGTIIKALTQGTQVKSGVLDPLGADIAPGPGLYFTLLSDLAAAMKTCLVN